MKNAILTLSLASSPHSCCRVGGRRIFDGASFEGIPGIELKRARLNAESKRRVQPTSGNSPAETAVTTRQAPNERR